MNSSISNSESAPSPNEIWRMIIWVLLFILPVSLPMGFVLWLIIRSGELIKPENVIILQNHSDTPVLYGPAYHDPSLRIKRMRWQEESPEVVAIGSSRVMQLRAEFFSDRGSFLNAGGVLNIFSLRHSPFLLNPDTRPGLLVIGLDQWLFNADFPRYNPEYTGDSHWDRIETRYPYKPYDFFEKRWREMLRHIKKGILDPWPLLRSSNTSIPLGLDAWIHGGGYLRDMSYLYSDRWNIRNPEHEDFEFHKSLRVVANHETRFERGTAIDMEAVQEVARALEFCRAQGIDVIAFLPPYAGPVVDAMAARQKDFAYVFQLYDALKPVFDQYGFALYDFTDIRAYDCNDDDFTDGFHAGESAHRKMMEMALRNMPTTSAE